MQHGGLPELTAFVVVADHLSFRAAASRLGVTPPALSHSMRQLEERLKVRLLNRTTRSVSLTIPGRTFFCGSLMTSVSLSIAQSDCPPPQPTASVMRRWLLSPVLLPPAECADEPSRLPAGH
jgi:Bacterial regulatory helix-turn-helix protein, lysR family